MASYYLFGGEHTYCLPGMDGYIGAYDEVEHAMKSAEGNEYDWVHIAQPSPLGLKIIQVGRWNDGLKRMVWQADFSPVKQRDRYIKTFCSVMYSGVLLIGKLSCNRDRIPKSRMALMTQALSLYDDIQMELGTMATDSQNTSIHLARQIIEQMICKLKAIPLSHKQQQELNRWIVNANALLDSTKDLNLFTDQWEKSL